MKIEKIKKNHKKEIIIGGLILVSIVSAITLVTTRAKYRVTQNIKLASGSVNYKPYDFKIMAMYQQNDSGEYTEINAMPTNGYVVNKEKSYCTTDNKNQVKEKLSTNSNGEHIFKNLKKSDKCYIWFDKKKQIDNSTNLIDSLNPKDTTPDFSKIASTDEGIFITNDPMYGTNAKAYYWRGAVLNNHLIFANMCWRIIRINGDKSLRLIYNGPLLSENTCSGNGGSTLSTTTGTPTWYNTSYNNAANVGWTYTTGSQRTLAGTDSNAKVETENWYDRTIGNNTEYDNLVVEGKFCNDRNVETGSTWNATGTEFNYAVDTRINSNQPTLSCPNGDVYTLKVGAITADEPVYI